MFQDTRVLARHGEFAALWERHPIVFRDQSVVDLHLVRRGGIDEKFFRAMLHEGQHWCVFDLRKINSTFAGDLAALPARDHAGVTLYTLRDQFPDSAGFIAQAFKNFVHVWTEGIGEPLLITGSAPDPERLTFQPALKTAA